MTYYRNWPEICRIGYRNPILMLVLSSVKLDDRNEIFIGLYTGFNQCFSLEKVDGPFPLSVIRELAYEEALKSRGFKSGADYPDSYDILQNLQVPTVLFEVSDDGHQDTNWPLFPLPEAEAIKLKQGDLIEWKGTSLVVMENNRNEKLNEWRICCSPAECIALDL